MMQPPLELVHHYLTAMMMTSLWPHLLQHLLSLALLLLLLHRPHLPSKLV